MIGATLCLAATAIFWYRMYQVYAAFKKFIHRAVTTDLFDIAKNYGMSETEKGEKTGVLAPIGPNGFWVAEMYDEDSGDWEIVGCTGIGEQNRPCQA